MNSEVSNFVFLKNINQFKSTMDLQCVSLEVGISYISDIGKGFVIRSSLLLGEYAGNVCTSSCKYLLSVFNPITE
jgi:hypothetical protein